jgi:hypothetical protein
MTLRHEFDDDSKIQKMVCVRLECPQMSREKDSGATYKASD